MLLSMCRIFIKVAALLILGGYARLLLLCNFKLQNSAWLPTISMVATSRKLSKKQSCGVV